MGGKRDLSARTVRRRPDNNVHQYEVQTARRLIYDKNFAVNSVAVDRILTGKSLVPTTVREVPRTSRGTHKLKIFVECLLSTTRRSRIQSF